MDERWMRNFNPTFTEVSLNREEETMVMMQMAFVARTNLLSNIAALGIETRSRGLELKTLSPEVKRKFQCELLVN